MSGMKMNNHSDITVTQSSGKAFMAPASQPNISVLIVEDQPLTLAGIKMSLADVPLFNVVGEATSGADAITRALDVVPDVILMDVELPGMDGIEASETIKRALPNTHIIMFTSHTSPAVVFAALKAGAEGFLSKSRSLEEITAAITAVNKGIFWIDPQVAKTVMNAAHDAHLHLSPMEKLVLESLQDGVSIAQLAPRLGATEDALTSAVKGVFGLFAMVPEQPFQPNFAPNIEPAIGTIFEGKYLIQSVAGKGGAGLVYRANHIFMERDVAIKMLHSTALHDSEAVRSFRQEAMAVACMEHPNIIRVYDFGVSVGGDPYLIMEFCEAATLRQILKSQMRLKPLEFFEVFIPICDALRTAHERGIVHCDLKPSNILVHPEGPSVTPKLADFGLAKFVHAEREHAASLEDSTSRTVQGTPDYMSPEQCLGEPLEPQSDIYSLACVMFEALVGRPLFEGKHAMEIFSQHIHAEPIRLNKAGEGLVFPIQLEELVSSMLEKDPRARCQSMTEVCDVLQQLVMQLRAGA
jgi:DNA-binding NarL/FixJ family response regulator